MKYLLTFIWKHILLETYIYFWSYFEKKKKVFFFFSISIFILEFELKKPFQEDFILLCVTTLKESLQVSPAVNIPPLDLLLYSLLVVPRRRPSVKPLGHCSSPFYLSIIDHIRLPYSLITTCNSASSHVFKYMSIYLPVDNSIVACTYEFCLRLSTEQSGTLYLRLEWWVVTFGIKTREFV